MRRRVAATAGVLLGSAAAHAKVRPSLLSEVVSQATRIVVARVTSVTVVTFWSGEAERPCGYRYQARVERTLKGAPSEMVEFFDPSLFPPLQHGERFLAFVESFDVEAVRERMRQEEFESELSRQEALCRIGSSAAAVRQVPRTLLPFHDFGDGDAWLRMTSYHSPFVPSGVPERRPADAPDGWPSDTRSMVRWKEVERLIEQQVTAERSTQPAPR